MKNINVDCIEAAKDVCKHFKNNKYVYKFACQSLAFATIGVYNIMLCNDYSKSELNNIRKEVLKIKNDIILELLPRVKKMQLILFINHI